MRISDSNAEYTRFRGSVKGTGYLLHSSVSPSLPLLCVFVCHYISTVLYSSLLPHLLYEHIPPWKINVGRQKKSWRDQSTTEQPRNWLTLLYFWCCCRCWWCYWWWRPNNIGWSGRGMWQVRDWTEMQDEFWWRNKKEEGRFVDLNPTHTGG